MMKIIMKSFNKTSNQDRLESPVKKRIWGGVLYK